MFWWAYYRAAHIGLPTEVVDIVHSGLSARGQVIPIEQFRNGKTKILFGTSKISAGMNFPDVEIVIQYQCQDLTIADFDQLRGRGARSKDRLAVGIIFVEPSMWPGEISIENPGDQDPGMVELVQSTGCAEEIIQRHLGNPPHFRPSYGGVPFWGCHKRLGHETTTCRRSACVLFSLRRGLSRCGSKEVFLVRNSVARDGGKQKVALFGIKGAINLNFSLSPPQLRHQSLSSWSHPFLHLSAQRASILAPHAPQVPGSAVSQHTGSAAHSSHHRHTSRTSGRPRHAASGTSHLMHTPAHQAGWQGIAYQIVAHIVLKVERKSRQKCRARKNTSSSVLINQFGIHWPLRLEPFPNARRSSPLRRATADRGTEMKLEELKPLPNQHLR
ncbi:hypothetical protein DFH08DRAFT_799871 [Mycena albidolilacea]|uniref:Helicase C-terminal domain-containing protein n=1 Tax=Mycena albidolilacea TaxID=1033008 RepID=A0AAD7F2G3_9AGAR|nr:hypothetical protein DFH08DRAFT_799871 [Mycena albidolilacea]